MKKNSKETLIGVYSLLFYKAGIRNNDVRFFIIFMRL